MLYSIISCVLGFVVHAKLTAVLGNSIDAAFVSIGIIIVISLLCFGCICLYHGLCRLVLRCRIALIARRGK